SFFFSSRRRHTRSDRDWSSDVCSSDLEAELRAWLAIGPSADGPWCARPKEAQVNFRWQKTLELAAVEARLAVGRLRDLAVIERGDRKASCRERARAPADGARAHNEKRS